MNRVPGSGWRELGEMTGWREMPLGADPGCL